ncbi:hypothetical protein KDD17_03145 [Sulfitobacter albidus]|uniref:Uncharacterized protein n=1 Tax=Sulfitobacter albidus TaxID=2829501 RepID=A0A975PN34_9RHOB|nr:hypothetical protein [Sulfitobacter albidus]QUJ77046.1 hypothetical protein KDD17_03145 [Sulfitobacter albidus]
MKKHVLVFISDPILRDDVIETVNEVHPQAQIEIAEDYDQACERLHALDGWAWAIINPELDRAPIDASLKGLGFAMQARAALPVVLSAPVRDTDTQNWIFLEPPFNTPMLRDALLQTLPTQASDPI